MYIDYQKGCSFIYVHTYDFPGLHNFAIVFHNFCSQFLTRFFASSSRYASKLDLALVFNVTRRVCLCVYILVLIYH